jgi:hypothetical protein
MKPVSIDSEAPKFSLPAYDPIKDDEVVVTLESQK